MIILFDNSEIYMYMVSNKKCSKNVVLEQVLHGCKGDNAVSFEYYWNAVLQYFVSRHFTECSIGHTTRR